MDAPEFDCAPVIETERLILRALEARDHEAYATLWADPIVVRYTSRRPLTREESWIRLLRQFGHWRVLGFGFWAIEDRASGRLAGEAGFHDLRRDIEPAFDGTPEAGWLLGPEFQGKGLAREALAAIHAWGDAQLRSEKTVCIIDPDHEPSLRVARHFGYRDAIAARYHDAPTLILTRQRPTDSQVRAG